MTQERPSPENIAGALSPDGHFYWDGAEWRSTLSPDGSWRWNGAAWVAAPVMTGSGQVGPYVSARRLGIWVSALLGITGAVAVAEALFVNDFIVFAGWAGDLRLKYSVGFFGLLIFAVTAGLFLVWFHRAHRNVAAFGTRGLRFSAAWAVGWWFIPVAGLWKPYRAAVEMWEGSSRDATLSAVAESNDVVGDSVLIRCWWAAWVVCLLLFNVAAFAVTDNSVIYWQSALSAQATVIAALLAIFFVTSVGARQDERWRQLARAVQGAVTPTRRDGRT
jgi:uncharacterized protein DUF4328